METLVFIAFVSLNTPHDCFECLSVDSSIHISTFQLTRAERKLRKQYSKAGELGMSNLIGVASKRASGLPDDDDVQLEF